MKKIILLCLLVIGLLLVGCTTEIGEPADSSEEVLPEIEDEAALAGQAGGNTVREYTYHSCNDTDGGENFYGAGIVTITYDLVYKDKATGQVIKTYSNRVFDYADRLYNGMLYERFCKPGFVSGQSKSPLGFSKMLSASCSNGFSTSAVTSLSGKTLDKPSYGYVGYCAQELGPCTDSDGGDNPFVKGETQGYTINGAYFEQEDSCSEAENYFEANYFDLNPEINPDDVGVVEHVCGNVVDGEIIEIGVAEGTNIIAGPNWHKCEFGCQDGACVEEEPISGCCYIENYSGEGLFCQYNLLEKDCFNKAPMLGINSTSLVHFQEMATAQECSQYCADQ